jgi:hypothetical protein
VSRAPRLPWLALPLVLALASCREQAAPELLKQQLDAPPADIPLKLGYVFGDGLELIGARVSPTQHLKPNTRVEVTLYWRKRGSVPAGSRLFTHVLDEAGEKILNLDAVGVLRKTVAGNASYPPSSWKSGKVYVDSFAFWIPSSVRTDSISLVCGLYRDQERLAISGENPDTPAHLRGRALVAKLPITRSPAPATTPAPLLWVPRRPSAVAIDGKLDEPAWVAAASTGTLVNVQSGEPVSGNEVTGSVRLLYDERALYVGFEVTDEDLRGGFDPARPDPHLWTRDTVELMIDPDGDGDNRDYYEIQVGPQNLVFDSFFDAYNSPRSEPDGPFGHQEWSAQLTSAVVLHGTLDDEREDEGYTVELSVPWKSFDRARRVPPSEYDVWRMNFYAMQNNGGAAWSPILGQGNFHKASRFGRVRFTPAPAAGVRKTP